MHAREYDSAGPWLDHLAPLLLAAEAENNLPLGLAAQAVEQPQATPGAENAAGLRLWGVFDRDEPVGAALLTSVNLVLSRQPEEALVALADLLEQSQTSVPGVVGPDEVPGRFAAIWAPRIGGVPCLRMRQRIHACSEVVWHERAAGQFRAATEDDAALLAEWSLAFARDVNSNPPREGPLVVVRRMIARQRLFVWTLDREIVSCAAAARPSPSGIAVNFVYTPPAHRSRGFATSCVAELTSHLLAEGRRFCCLYTDLANPVSNAIYARIGYQPVCDSQWLDFGGGEASAVADAQLARAKCGRRRDVAVKRAAEI
jgi:uncharacterized protein